MPSLLETKRLQGRPDVAARRLRGGMLVVAAFVIAATLNSANAANAKPNTNKQVWIGTWATAAQAAMPGALQRFRNQTVRLAQT